LNPVLTFIDPATPADAVLSNITLELYFRVEPSSCESEIEVRLTDPAGNVTMYTPFATCNGPGQLYFVTLNVPSGQTTGSIANWETEFRDTNDQNVGLAEYSVRWGRLTYDADSNGAACASPEIVNCPASITKSSEFGICGADITVPEPIFGVDFTDCTDATITNSITGTSNASGFYPVGTTTVIWTVTDLDGNTTACTQTITVDDVEPPTVICPDDFTLIATLPNCDAVANWNLPTITDNCGASIVSNSDNPGDVFPLGTTTVTYIVSDDAGNTATCSFDVRMHCSCNLESTCIHR